MYTLADYGDMVADRGRTSAYARALEQLVTSSSVVLDIGAGPGILSLLACRAGARKVYAVEPDDVIQVAREVAAANGFADRIEFVQAMTADIDLPERVDGIVADIHGVLPQSGESLVSILDARRRLLRPGGWIVPARETIWAAPVSSPVNYERTMNAWTTEYGFDLSAARIRSANEWVKRWLSPDELLAEPGRCAVLDYHSLDGPNMSGEVSWVVARDGVAHGLGVWFDAETAPGVGFSNSPASGESHVYGQGFFVFPDQVTLSAGDLIRVRLRADFAGDGYFWGWDTHVTDGSSGRQKATYRQSTWLAASLTPEKLRRRAGTFVPTPGDDARIDRCILELMDQKMSLGEMAAKVAAAFPLSFRSTDVALARVGWLSQRYSK
jgi:protein arginine N-methyltransferase 1